MQAIYRRLLLWAFERLYRELAWSYDLVAALVSRGYWRVWTLAALPFVDGQAVLELGCGTGHVQLALARRELRHVGYDASPQMIARARRRLHQAGRRATLVQGRAEQLALRSRRFSDVVATFPAPYILEQRTLDEIRRVLRKDGRLVIVDGGQLDQSVYAAVVAAAYHAAPVEEGGERYRARLEQAGFTVLTRRVRLGRSSVDVVIAQPT